MSSVLIHPAARSVALAVALIAVLAGCHARGPAPTEASVTGELGPFAIASATVAAGEGFGGGTVYYPTDTSQGRFGGVAVAPGFLMAQSTIQWLGPRLASQGFVVITIDTNSVWDDPSQRGDQLMSALDHLTERSVAADRVDPGRLAVMGWSMGGGGALEASLEHPELRASIPLAPWAGTPDWSAVTVPTLVVGCEADTIAPIAGHAEPMYASLDPSLRRAYLEIEGADHFCVTSGAAADVRATIARQVVSFLKRFVDGDTRYSPFLCPGPADGGLVSEYRTNCPYEAP